MIVPFFKGVLRFHFVPITWMLFFINGAFLIFSGYQYPLEKKLKSFLQEDYFVESGGAIFSSFILENTKLYSPAMRSLAEIAKEGSAEKIEILGHLVLSDKYLERVLEDPGSYGDKVAFSHWKSKVLEIKKVRTIHPSYMLGVSKENYNWSSWLSYQFIHSGYFHFLVNMVALLVVGSALEPIIGGVMFLLVYLLSGVIAALFFSMASGVGVVPLIGASGAVSGVMALLAGLTFFKPVRYIYFLFIPKAEYSGFVFLPGGLTLLIWSLSDLAGYFGSVSEWGGVAYAAHLGGELAGLLVALGLGIYGYFNKKGCSHFFEAEPIDMGTKIPFVRPSVSDSIDTGEPIYKPT